jgi:hypothetical protein
MSRATPLIAGVLVVLLAGCATAVTDQPTSPPGASDLLSSGRAPDSPSPSPSLVSAGSPVIASPSPSTPPAPTDVAAKSAGPGKPGTMFTVHLTWAGAAATDRYRIYKTYTGETRDPRCVFNKELSGGPLVETQPGATGVEVELDSAETGAGTRCLYVVAVSAAGESAPMLAWSSSATSPSPSATTGVTGCATLSYDYAADARGSKANPTRLAIRALTGLRPTDVLARADVSDGGAVLVVRDDQQIGRLEYVRDPDGGWLLVRATLCGGLAAR